MHHRPMVSSETYARNLMQALGEHVLRRSESGAARRAVFLGFEHSLSNLRAICSCDLPIFS